MTATYNAMQRTFGSVRRLLRVGCSQATTDPSVCPTLTDQVLFSTTSTHDQLYAFPGDTDIDKTTTRPNRAMPLLCHSHMGIPPMPRPASGLAIQICGEHSRRRDRKEGHFDKEFMKCETH